MVAKWPYSVFLIYDFTNRASRCCAPALEVALEQRKLAVVPWSIRFSLSETFRPNTHFYKNLACRLECVHLPLLEPPPDLLVGDLLFSTDSSSSADDGGDTSPWSTIAFALTSFP